MEAALDIVRTIIAKFKSVLKDSAKGALTDAGTSVGAGLIDQAAHSAGGRFSQPDVSRGLDLGH